MLDDDGKLERKADMFHKRTIKQQRSVDSVDTASEALAVCIGEKACVDLDFMASLMGGSEKIPQIVEDLKGVIYKEPNSGPFDLQDGGEHWAKGWQTADEYLSGNVRQKLRTAQRVAARDPFFAGNVDALITAQPKDLEASEIKVRLGATWLDKKYIEQFMYETFETPRYLRGQIEISYVPYTAEWQVSRKSMVRYNDVAAFTTYGTDRASAYRLLEDTLNLRDIRIYDTIEDADGRERRVLNAKETTLAAQKQQLIRDAFKDWIWKDPERRETLVRQYNEEMNSTRPREYDGSHIVFSGMNPEITLREHQKNAIAHVLYGGNTLLAHEVGAGKTFEMVASAMESKRLGLCQKSIFVVPNHLTEQWASEFLRLYPSANILVTMNEAYCRDISIKTRSSLDVKRRNGDFVGAFPVYGYMKAEDNKNLLVPDPYAARVVCGIFRMRLEGASASKIASELNRLGILSPLAYKKNNGLPYAKKGYADKADCKWSATTIIRILQDETYTGMLVQGKQGTPHYKIKQMEQRPASEWVRVPDAHEALIARQDFELVQRIKGLDTRTSPNEDTVYLFSGILICGCCGSRMTRKTNRANGKEYHYYYCPTGKKKGCAHPVMLKESSLIDCVRDSLKAYIGNIASLEALLTGIDQSSIN